MLTTELEEAQGWPVRCVVGVDEVGRGPWAGPVVAACIVLPPDYAETDLAALNDSKKLTEKKRTALFELLKGLPHGIGQASVDEIDELNILQASLLAMHRAVAVMPNPPDHVLVDGHKLPDWPFAASAIIKGDSLSPSIAAASVLAKVTRDRYMAALDRDFPGYGWAQNMGYGTKAHQIGLAERGVTPHHRKSFAPIRKILSPEN
ncbi:MAG: ribonuclease HII [Parvibaculales bacterium]